MRYWISLIILFTPAVTMRAEIGAARAEFVRAYNAAGTTVLAQDDGELLRTYALYPYLRQQRLRSALAKPETNGSATDRAAEDFLRDYGNEPVTRELRRLWLASLAQRGEWERYLANYRETDDKSLRCHAFTARLKLQRLDGLASAIAQLWATSGESLPACEAPFEWLKTQSLWTPELIKRRVRLALSLGNTAFARQLIPWLPSERVAPLWNWVALIETPQRAIDRALADPDKPIELVALLEGWTRLVRASPEAGLHRYAQLVRARQLDVTTASRFALELALALAWNRRPEALSYFTKVRSSDFDERAFEWYARAALWNDAWQLLTKVIDSMPETLRSQTRWRYWRARSASLQGAVNGARAQYTALLGDDNYYAALAAARLHKPYTPQQIDIEPNEAQLQYLAREPAFVRARELRLTSIVALRAAANDEWRFGLEKLPPELRAQAVILASRWQWYEQAILTAAEQRLFNDYRLLYPHAFDTEVATAAKLTGLSRALIYAILRQESLFQVDAVSSAGALGLMQLLPETARRTARRFGLPPPDDLFDPAANITLGAAYFKGYVQRFDGRIALALASYNAGPNAVARWLPAKPKDMDAWIENIPFNETRTYVQRALWHSVVFGWLADGRGQDVSHWLTTVPAVSHRHDPR